MQPTLDMLRDTSPVALALIALWKLPEWVRKWIAVARDVRGYRSGR